MFMIAVPVANTKNVVSGVLVVAISGLNMSDKLQQIGQGDLDQEVISIGSEGRIMIHPDVSKLNTLVNESTADYDLWKSDVENLEGFNWRGVNCLFGASKLAEYNQTVIVSEPIQKALDVSKSWLAWMLYLILIVGVIVLISYIYIKNTRPEKN